MKRRRLFGLGFGAAAAAVVPAAAVPVVEMAEADVLPVPMTGIEDWEVGAFRRGPLTASELRRLWAIRDRLWEAFYQELTVTQEPVAAKVWSMVQRGEG